MDRLRLLIEELSNLGLYCVAWCGSPVPGQEMQDLIDRLPSKLDPAEVHAVSRDEAATWLSLLATHSLMHNCWSTRGGARDAALLLETIEVALNDLSPNAEFLAIGVWKISRRLRHWERLRGDGPWPDRRYSLHCSGPYIEGHGVVGAIMAYDEKKAFLFAVIEDD